MISKVFSTPRKDSVPKYWKLKKTRSALECSGVIKSWIKCQASALTIVYGFHSTTETYQGRSMIHFDTDSKPLKIDNCATRSISNNIDDFVGTLTPSSAAITGIGGKIEQVMEGTICWWIEDDEGHPHKILLPGSFYAKSSPSCLLSPQHWAQTAKDNSPYPNGTWCATYGNQVVLYWNQQQYKRTILLDPNETNVATIRTAPGYSKYQAFTADIGLQDNEVLTFEDNVLSDEDPDSEEDKFTMKDIPLTTDFNLEGPSNEATSIEETNLPEQVQDSPTNLFLQYHYRLGHLSMKKIHFMAKTGRLPAKLTSCPIPICTSCMYGKASRRPWRSKTPSNNALSKTIAHPGDCVSVDQLASTTPGLIAQLRGIPTKHRYRAATVFVDHHSGLSYVHLQQTTDAEETVAAKQAFEQFAASHGVTIQHYHADNGLFADNKFRNAIEDSGQTLTFCGVNAHFQNGVAERRIRELQDQARTMLIHASTHWPNAINAHLWPYALRMANDIFNTTYDLKRKQVPIEIFAKTNIQDNPNHWYTFGCPVYVLDANLQAGKKIDKWSERSKVAIYLGRSPAHARTVALCLSLKTGNVSPQFHFKADPMFQTLVNTPKQALPLSEWQAKCHFILTKPGHDKQNPSTDEASPAEESEAQQQIDSQGTHPFPENASPAEDSEAMLQNDISNHIPQGISSTSARHQQQVMPPSEGAHLPQEAQQQQQHLFSQTRSGRLIRPPARLIEAHAAEIAEPRLSLVTYEVLQELQDADDLLSQAHPLLAYAASADPDTMYLHQAMQQPDRDQFLEAMEQEVTSQSENGNWKIVHKSVVPATAQVVPAVWSMKRKRKTTGEIYKWKARLTVDGSKQKQGVNYWLTYSPVASWPTIRLILTYITLCHWQTRQIDYVQAFPQADAETDNLFMKIPRGYEIPGAPKDEYVLQIIKNIYGQKQAGRVWYKYLTAKLQSIGFIVSTIDPCLFYRQNCIYILYVDDSILAGPTDTELDEVIHDIKQVGLQITVEGDIGDFLGVNIDRKADGTIHLTQPHLIDQILSDLRLDKANTTTKETPAKVNQLLKRHTNSQDFDGHYKYRSVIGKLNYLEQSTRPDIAYAVHQCARFSASPNQEHGKAIKWLGRYLLGTRNKGLIFTPTSTSLECYVDADFSGAWDPTDAADDIDTARSRSGYVAMYGGCPIFWKSKLQSIIALSSTEAEYVSLSTTMRDVIPIMDILKEMNTFGFKIHSPKPKLYCKVFEDNSGAIEIATNEKFRPRTKHINVRYHHFRSYVNNGTIKILPIQSHDQRADILTKPTNAPTLMRHRKSILGW